MSNTNQRLREAAAEHFSRFAEKVKTAEPAVYGIVVGTAFLAGVTVPAISAELAQQALMEAQGLKDAYIAANPKSGLQTLWLSLQGKVSSPTLQHASVSTVANLAVTAASTLGVHLAQRYSSIKSELLALQEKSLNAGIPLSNPASPGGVEEKQYDGPRGATPLSHEELLAKQAARSENSLAAQLERGIQAIENEHSPKKNMGPRFG